MPLGQEVLTDYATHGLSLKAHPVSLVRGELDRRNIITAAELQDESRSPHGRWVKVAGLVLVRQRPGTASGVVFETIEDETGIANLILWSDIYEHTAPPLGMRGCCWPRDTCSVRGRSSTCWPNGCSTSVTCSRDMT